MYCNVVRRLFTFSWRICDTCKLRKMPRSEPTSTFDTVKQLFAGHLLVSDQLCVPGEACGTRALLFVRFGVMVS